MRLERITLYQTSQERQAIERATLSDLRDRREHESYLLSVEFDRLLE